MRRRTLIIAGIAVTALLAACAGGPAAGGFQPVGDGSSFDPDSTFMSAGPDWGDAVQKATFVPGVEFDGVRAIEVEMPYGETTVAYNFGGYDPGTPVEISMDVNFDFFMQNAFIYLAYLSRYVEATEAEWPRPEISDFREYQWIDSIGRFAGSGWPDATEGWETVSHTVEAGEDGYVTLIMMINHWTESPALTWQYFTEPVARVAEEGSE
jgi:hypothetical protein